jgi:hypothetical protein
MDDVIDLRLGLADQFLAVAGLSSKEGIAPNSGEVGIKLRNSPLVIDWPRTYGRFSIA